MRKINQEKTKYFTEEKNISKIKPAVKRMVTFCKQPIHNAALPSGSFDLILCRNLLIYFDEQTRLQILSTISRSLESNGFLILGGAESARNVNSLLKPVRIQSTKSQSTIFYSKIELRA